MSADQRDISSIVKSVNSGATSAASVIDAALRRIEAHNPQINAFHEVYADRARAAAETIDQSVAAGREPTPLAGVPIAVKDNIATDFGHTACGSRFLERYRSPFSATVVSRLERAGAIIIGKTNCDEFAMGSSTEHCAFGAVRNPCDPERSPGGSSGGSAAAVAAGMVPAALGSDTGGSIRQPAAMCGIVGFKPTYGRVSRWGLVAFGSSLDQIGPLTNSVRDAALIYNIIAGPDQQDFTTDNRAADVPVAADRHAPLRVGVVGAWHEGNDPTVNDALANAVQTYRELGAEIIDIDLPLSAHGVETYYVIAPAEASSNLARYDGVRFGRRAELAAGEGLIDLYERSRTEGFGPEVKRRIILGTFVLSAGYYDAYYKRASQVRRLIRRDFDQAFSRCDVILGPTTPTPAFRLGEKQDPMSMYMCDLYTVNANMAGLCAISLPGGWTGDGLPVGVQLQARPFDEATLLQAAITLEAGLKLERPMSGSAPARSCDT